MIAAGGSRLSPARENSSALGGDHVPLGCFLDEAESLQALHGNPIERGLFGPADDSSKHDPLGRAEPDFWGFHQSNVPS
jgi:hypothetical protein